MHNILKFLVTIANITIQHDIDFNLAHLATLENEEVEEKNLYSKSEDDIFWRRQRIIIEALKKAQI